MGKHLFQLPLAVSRVSLWAASKLFLSCLWAASGLPLDCLWAASGVSLGYLWLSLGCLWDACPGVPVVCLWQCFWAGLL